MRSDREPYPEIGFAAAGLPTIERLVSLAEKAVGLWPWIRYPFKIGRRGQRVGRDGLALVRRQYAKRGADFIQK
jgi:hypothetical protein